MPELIKAVKDLMKNMNKNIDNTTSLEKKIKSMEDNLKQQSKIISQMADQIQKVSEGLQILTFRVSIIFLISIIALAIGLGFVLKEIIT